MACIYAITNKINGKMYIGQTWNYEARMKYHKSSWSRCRAIHSAIKKYGDESFIFEKLHDGIDSQDMLDSLEIHEIWRYMTIAPCGYNLRDGGDSGGIPSHETRILIGKKASMRVVSDDTKRKISNKSKEMWENIDFRKKHAEKMALVTQRPEWKAKNDMIARWETRRKNNPNWKEDAAETCRRITKTDIWKEANRLGMIKRREGDKWKKQIEQRMVRCLCVETGVEYGSQTEASIAVGCPSSSINRACRVPTRTAGGFHWKRVEK